MRGAQVEPADRGREAASGRTFGVRPRSAAAPTPAVFGYHELFHALTIVGVACQYVAIAFFIVRDGSLSGGIPSKCMLSRFGGNAT